MNKERLHIKLIKATKNTNRLESIIASRNIDSWSEVKVLVEKIYKDFKKIQEVLNRSKEI